MIITEETIARFRKGDIAVFDHLFNTYWKRMYAAAWHRLQDEKQAQDIVQDVFTRLWDRRERLMIHPENMEFYLLKAVKHEVINFYHAEKVKTGMMAEALRRMEQLTGENIDTGTYLALENFLDNQVKQFPATMRNVFLLRNDHQSIRQIAERLNLAEQTVKNNLTEASRRLRKAIREEFSDERIIWIVTVAVSVTFS